MLSGREVVKALSKVGFALARQKGSHIILTKETEESKKGVVVPNHKEIAKGTLRSIIEDAGLTVKDLIDLL